MRDLNLIMGTCATWKIPMVPKDRNRRKPSIIQSKSDEGRRLDRQRHPALAWTARSERYMCYLESKKGEELLRIIDTPSFILVIDQT